MMRHKYILSVLLLMGLTACQDDFMEGGSGGKGSLTLSVAMGEDFVASRSVENPEFQEGTLFHLYGSTTMDNAENWDFNYLSADGKQNTAAKAVGGSAVGNLRKLVRSAEYSNFDLATVFHVSPLNLYGLTIAGVMADETPDSEELILANNQLLEKYKTSKQGRPHYKMSYAQTNNAPLQDIMYSGTLKGLTPFKDAGNVVLPFTHTLSKLNFYAVEADGLDAAYAGKMKITSITVTDYPEGELCMGTGLYTRTDGKRTQVVGVADFKEDVALTGNAQKFATTLIFPTTGTAYEKNPVKQDVDDDNAVTIHLTVDINGTPKTFSPKLTYADGKVVKNEEFKPNREYDITFTLTTNSVVVTLVPKYYDYIEDPYELTNYELGEPIDFGGVLWAAQNLGATSSLPTTSAIAWEKARGFYYQYGRNIPYYARGSMEDPYPMVSIYGVDGFKYKASDPASWWDGEIEQYLYTNDKSVRVPFGNTVYANGGTTSYDENDKKYFHGARAFPYIPSLWEKIMRQGKTYADYLVGSRFYTSHSNVKNGQTAPDMNCTDPYAANSATFNDLNKFAFSAYYTKEGWGGLRYWNKEKTSPTQWGTPMNTPAPKGWRLPSKNEYLSIYPSSEAAGDISFCGVHYAGPDKTEENQPLGGHVGIRVYDHVETQNDYNGKPAVYVGIYQDGSGYNDLGYGTFYDTSGRKCYDYKEGWGSVFAVKQQGTKEAYLLRWQIVIADYDEVSKGIVNPVRWDVKDKPYVGRGVVVISKYDVNEDYNSRLCLTHEENTEVTVGTKDAQHRCVVFLDDNGNRTWDDGEEELTDFDWNNPSGQLYLPIPGYVIVPSSGGQALIYPGCEALYWSSTASSAGNAVAIRAKYAGDYLSRYLYISNDEPIANGAHVRCVRDTQASYE